MRYLLPSLAAVALSALAACNASRVGAPAPALEGDVWVGSEGEAVPIESRWVLVEFFSPG